MTCFHPNMVLIQKNKVIRKDGKPGSKISRIIMSGAHDFKGYEYYLNENKRLYNLYKDLYPEDEIPKYIFIPCGKCIGCRAQERKNWALRIELECKKYDHNYFITLTYNPESITVPEYMINEATGEKIENPGDWVGTLVKEDTTKFIKHLRQEFDRHYDHWQGMKFYLCGEYGGEGDRPHYHAILMNCPDLSKELIYWSKNPKTGDPLYRHERIEKIWGKGFVTIGIASWDSISYTAGYTVKKLFGDIKHEYYANKGQVPIFANMSRRPGIGQEYWLEHQAEIIDTDEIINSKGISLKPPRYFDRQAEENLRKEIIDEMKAHRQKVSEDNLKVKMSQTTLSIKEQLKIEEETAIEKQAAYKRHKRYVHTNLG